MVNCFQVEGFSIGYSLSVFTYFADTIGLKFLSIIFVYVFAEAEGLAWNDLIHEH